MERTGQAPTAPVKPTKRRLEWAISRPCEFRLKRFAGDVSNWREIAFHQQQTE
jgi:hypothetical protein